MTRRRGHDHHGAELLRRLEAIRLETGKDKLILSDLPGDVRAYVLMWYDLDYERHDVDVYRLVAMTYDASHVLTDENCV